mgnify:CR=1 FL=1
MSPLVEPTLEGATVDKRCVMGEDQLSGNLVVVGQQVNGHEAELGGDEQRQLDRLDVEVLTQTKRGRHFGQGLIVVPAPERRSPMTR